MQLLPNDIVDLSKASVDRVQLPLVRKKELTLDILRLDKIHPVISGNKWFKLKYHLKKALQENHPQVLTFGGSWSNHIVATACAARRIGLGSIGIIRGEEPAHYSNSLKAAVSFGMQLEFVSRSEYKYQTKPSSVTPWLNKYPFAYIIPEGGQGELGIQGVSEIFELVTAANYTHLICAMGTGTFLLGQTRKMLASQHLVGIPVLKGFNNWMDSRSALIDQSLQGRIHIMEEYHFGGYAKKNKELLQFMNDFYDQTQIPTDFVYTGKLMFATMNLIGRQYFQKGSSLLAIHSGGLQGNLSLPAQTLHF